MVSSGLGWLMLDLGLVVGVEPPDSGGDLGVTARGGSQPGPSRGPSWFVWLFNPSSRLGRPWLVIGHHGGDRVTMDTTPSVGLMDQGRASIEALEPAFGQASKGGARPVLGCGCHLREASR
ncbi:hypothetical protein NL676_014231 [Syzygium grande]|nr:hypothetical protein NL676_014231 [Syzygium grande]